MDSKVYKTNHNFQLLFPIFLYTAGTLLFGFWNIFGVATSLKAIYINLTGGEDYTEVIRSGEHDDFTNGIWYNLSKETASKMDRNVIELLLAIQEDFMNQNAETFSESNIRYLKDALSRKGYKEILEDDILDFIDALRIVVNKQD